MCGCEGEGVGMGVGISMGIDMGVYVCVHVYVGACVGVLVGQTLNSVGCYVFWWCGGYDNDMDMCRCVCAD